MKYGPLVFLAAFFALSASWCGFVLAPQVQLGRDQPTNAVGSDVLYPQGRPGLARQGLEVYRANGCAYCHSQQVGQTGIEFNLVLNELGTNPVAVAEALVAAQVGVSNASPPRLAARLPGPVARNLDPEKANNAAKALKAAGGSAFTQVVPLGPDITRTGNGGTWGNRRTVAADFLYDYPVMPGSLRVGPDLANVGLRLPDSNWHLRHLYAPRTMMPNSAMPAYQFLFEERKLKPGQTPSPDGIPLTDAGIFFDVSKDTGPIDREIVPKPEAKALVAYLLSLQANVPLYEAPMAMAAPPAATNAPATNAPAQ